MAVDALALVGEDIQALLFLRSERGGLAFQEPVQPRVVRDQGGFEELDRQPPEEGEVG